MEIVRVKFIPFLFVALAFCLTGCGGGSEDSASAQERELCAAVRGNGVRMFAHFTALARSHEVFGTVDAMSGGSSGSIVSYLSDAIYSNPLLNECGDRKCSKDEVASRIALLYKTVGPAIVRATHAKSSYLFDLPTSLLKVLDQNNIEAMLKDNPSGAVQLFNDTINQKDFKSVINPEIYTVMSRSEDKAGTLADLLKGIRGTNDFTLDSSLIFVRPGILDFNVLIDVYGHIGSFYAMTGPYADRSKMQEFLSLCSLSGIGLSWPDLSKRSAGQSTCGNLFEELAAASFSHINELGDWLFTNRPVATTLPALVSVSSMLGDSAVMLREAKLNYELGKPVQWKPNFDEWRVLYAGRADDLKLLMKNRNNYSDLKTKRAFVQAQMTWRDIMTRSGSEPGQQAAIALNDVGFTSGGWVDGQGVRPLMNIGCKKVILFDSLPLQSFQKDVAQRLGASDGDVNSLFDVNLASSSLSLNLEDASAVWCTDWNKAPAWDFAAVGELGWTAEVENRSLGNPKGYLNKIMNGRNLTACTPRPIND